MFQRNGQLLYRRFASYFFPTILMTMALSMSVVVDGIIVGNMLDASALAAVNLVLPLTIGFSVIYSIFGVGGSVLVALHKGRRDHAAADSIFSTGLICLILAGLLSMAGCVYWAEDLARILGGRDAALSDLVLRFLKPLAWGSPLFIVIPGFVYFMRTDGRPRLASAVLMVANILNLGFDILFIGLIGDIYAASLATVTGYAAGGMLLWIYLLSSRRSLHFVPVSRHFFSHARAIIRTGFSSGLSMGLQFLKIFCINALVLSIAGKSGMVAFSVCISCLSIASMFISGASQTMMPIVGVLFGEGDYRGIRFIFRRSLTIILVSTLILVALLEVFPENFIRLFGITDAKDLAASSEAVRIFAFSLLGSAFSFLMIFYVQTINRPGVSSLITLFHGFVFIVPLAWILSRNWGLTGIWLSFSIAEAASIFFVFILTFLVCRKSGGKLQGLLMLPKLQENSAVLDVTIRSRVEEAVTLSEQVTEFCLGNGVDPGTSNRVGLSVEEMAVNTARHGYGSGDRNYMDIAIAISEDEIRISFRDDGLPFNPTEHEKKRGDEPILGGISLIKTLAKHIEYAYSLGFNSTVIVVSRG